MLACVVNVCLFVRLFVARARACVRAYVCVCVVGVRVRACVCIVRGGMLRSEKRIVFQSPNVQTDKSMPAYFERCSWWEKKEDFLRCKTRTFL